MKEMKKFAITISLLLSTLLFTACSIFPKKIPAAEAELYAKECLNDAVSLASNVVETKKNSIEMRSLYHFKDARDIEFDVMVDNEFAPFVEGYIKNVYSGAVTISSDYKSSIMEYYSEDIDAIVSRLELIEDYKMSLNTACLLVYVSGNESLEAIADAIIEIDNLLDYDINLPMDEYSATLVKNIYWDNGLDGSIIISVSDPEEPEENRIYQTFDFSNGNDHILTYETVLRTLKANEFLKQTEEKIYFAFIDDTLFYGYDVKYSDETKNGVSDYDGVMKRYDNSIPYKNGYGNVGAGAPYKFGEDGTVYVYLSDGCVHLTEFN